ncbi:ATP synthase F1 subcomplex epsilon subunit [Pontibacter ummariensis]|uniref:ATP synthase F1 subcomplex epsilon subunit n=1 Tax=Pontibacter ummariensis TaxID=1610492 RepID=A0A239ED73_9BACT|nr:ATP synthase F1 subunit epsilon [Pontibacter ummariensis]PRY13200.1 ATP synthase F1 subcomplex epsilon subunit [Pontibacter ummariensis]SNS42596.1 ATP synthase F1 subcomplex epsilon subunit [Pontibacter ummariensis]
MYLEIITPDKKVYAGEVEAAQFPGSNGSFEVLDSHAPLISTMDKGRIRVTTGKGDEFFTVDGGVVEVLNNKIIVLAESVLS